MAKLEELCLSLRHDRKFKIEILERHAAGRRDVALHRRSTTTDVQKARFRSTSTDCHEICPDFGNTFAAVPVTLFYRQTSMYADLLQKYVRDSQWVDIQSPWLIRIATLRFEFSDDSSDLSHCEYLRLRILKWLKSRGFPNKKWLVDVVKCTPRKINGWNLRIRAPWKRKIIIQSIIYRIHHPNHHPKAGSPKKSAPAWNSETHLPNLHLWGSTNLRAFGESVSLHPVVGPPGRGRASRADLCDTRADSAGWGWKVSHGWISSLYWG